MTEPKYLIWSNYSLDYEDWREDLEAEYPELSEQEREEKMYERNSEYLDDERMNLDIQLDKPILVIVDLGLWNGRYSGYKEIKSAMICQNTVGQNSVWDADTIRGQEALIMPNGKKKGILPHGSTTKAGTNTIMNTGLIIVWRDRTFWRE